MADDTVQARPKGEVSPLQDLKMVMKFFGFGKSADKIMTKAAKKKKAVEDQQ
jgi:hypothetical protein